VELERYALRNNEEVKIGDVWIDRWELLELQPGEAVIDAPPVAGLAQRLQDKLLQLFR